MMKRKSKGLKIAIVAACPFPCQRGTPIRILRMSQALTDFGVDVYVVTYHLGEDIDTGGLKIHRTPNLKFYSKTAPGPSYSKLLIIDPMLAINLIRLHRQHRFDLIHAHHFEGLLAAWPIKLFWRLPVIFDAHTLLGSELFHYDLLLPERVKRFLGLVLDRYLPRIADFVICISEQIRSSFTDSAKIPAEKMELIPNGLELDHFINGLPCKRRFDAANPVLGFAGNFAAYQGIDQMLTAMRLLVKSIPGIQLNIYATDDLGDYRGSIARLGIAHRVRVIPTSYQQLPGHLAHADILLNPRQDGAGTPLKVLNYMSTGKPIITFSGSAHEIVHGETGWVVFEDNSEAFARGIRKVLADRELAERLGQNARDAVVKNYAWKSRAEEIIQIYDGLCRRT